MAPLRIGDVEVDDGVFMAYTVLNTMNSSALWKSGLLNKANPMLNSVIQASGTIIDMPFWTDLPDTVDAQENDGNTDIITQKLDSDIQRAVKNYKMISFGVNDFAALLAGSDPMGRISARYGEWWGREMERTVINPTLKGVFASTSMATKTIALNRATAGTPAPANKLTPDAAIDGRSLLGDAGNKLKVIYVHSDIYWSTMVKSNYSGVTTVPVNEQGMEIETWLGYKVVYSDSIELIPDPNNANKFIYPCYLMGNGAFLYAEGKDKVPAEMWRDPKVKGGEEELIQRRNFTLHPQGFHFEGTAVKKGATRVQLADGASWNAVYDNKNVPMVRILVNR
jgi:Major capsid protein 13-like